MNASKNKITSPEMKAALQKAARIAATFSNQIDRENKRIRPNGPSMAQRIGVDPGYNR